MTFSRKLVFLMSLWVIGGSAQATLLWDETLDGDLPNILFADQVSPNLTLLEGINEIRGSSSWTGESFIGAFDSDRARLTLNEGLQIDAIEYVFSNVNLLYSDPNFTRVQLQISHVLTRGRYASEDNLFLQFWRFSDVPGQESLPGISVSHLPVTQASNNYLFGTGVAGASLPAQWDYSWDYTAAITVSRSGVTPVSAPGTLVLVCLALAGLIRRQS